MLYSPTGRPWSPARALAHKAIMVAELWRGCRVVMKAHGVPLQDLLREYRIVRRATLASPREYFRYRLWDTTRPMAERSTFMTWARRRPLEALFNPNTQAVEIRSKLRSEEHFLANDLPAPRRIGRWQPADGAEVLASLLRDWPDGVVMKPEHGDSGHGVRVFTAIEGERLRDAEDHWVELSSLAALLAQSREVIVIQERVVSHPALAELAGNPFAASLRLVTCLRDDQRVLLLPATLKLPSARTGIDNFGAGNVAIAVDDRGVMGEGSLGLDGPSLAHHPVTGLAFAGRTVPYFAEAVALVQRGQRSFPKLRSIGWDVAITPDGPRVLEANAWWGVDVIQQPGLRGLLQGEFLEFLRELGAPVSFSRGRVEED
jgi:hypothetical protein